MKTSTCTLLTLATGFAQLGMGQSQQTGTEYHAIKKLLQSRFDDTCEQRVVGRDTNFPTTHVSCIQPGGAAYLQAAGMPPGPTPQFLRVCTIGSEGIMTCNKVRFRGNYAKDIQKAMEILGEYNPVVNNTDFTALVELLNEDYDNTCVTTTSPGIMSNTTVNCTKPGGYATLVEVTADTYPPQSVPSTLTVCMYGALMQPSCQTINLTGDETQDLMNAKQLIAGNTTTTSEYEQIVQVLYSAYNSTEDCRTSFVSLPPAPTMQYIKCVRPGSNATLSAEQGIGAASPTPESLQACMIGSFDNARCQNINFIGNAAKDVAAAQFLLGQYS